MQELPTIPKDLLERVSMTLKKITRAASEHYGADCYLQALLAQHLLKREGFETRVASGEAAWRVGNGDSDVIVHAKAGNYVPQPGALLFHSWLIYGHDIIDFTTYQLREKAEQLDALDGGSTTVDWCPEYLYVKSKSGHSVHDVTQGQTGLYHYRQDFVIEGKLKAHKKPLDNDAKNYAEIVYANPQMEVFGTAGASDIPRKPIMKPG